MRGPRRNPAAAILLLLAALIAVAGCGLGPGDDLGEVDLNVTRDFGAEPVVPSSADEVNEADTVMRVLEGGAEIETRYGGGFVQAIEGLEADASGAGGPMDWFFFVDGIESSVGAADFPLEGGERVWWDYRNWSAAMRVPAVVGSWPAPFAQGYGGRPRPVAIECLGAPPAACETARERVEGTGARIVPGATPSDAIRVLVGPWSRLREDATAGALGVGPRKSGVYVEAAAGGLGLAGLDERGHPARRLRPDAGLVAATSHLDDPPVWVVTGGSPAGVIAAANLLDEEALADRYAVATEGGREIPLPLR